MTTMITPTAISDATIDFVSLLSFMLLIIKQEGELIEVVELEIA